MKTLWTLATQAAERSLDEIDEHLFQQCLDLAGVSLNNLSIALFWINPENFLPTDKKSIAYGATKGIGIDPYDFQSYHHWMSEMIRVFGNNFPEISRSAHIFALQPIKGAAETTNSRRFWNLSAGKEGKNWDEFYEKDIITIGFDPTPDLRQFKNYAELQQKFMEMHPGKSNKNNALACWQFAHVMKKGDIVFAKQGMRRLLGCGIVEGDYFFDETRQNHKHIRSVKWLANGEWNLPEDNMMARKTLTDITPYADHVQFLSKTAGVSFDSDQPRVVRESTSPYGVSYWWLNANPKMWDFEDLPVGGTQTYTSHNEQGNKRQKYKYFAEVKPGDIVVGYVTSPQKEIVAICNITKELHQTDQGESIEIKKTEQLKKRVPLELLRETADLRQSEPIISNQGSLFKLTAEEYEIIRTLIDDLNIPVKVDVPIFTKAMAMQRLFFQESEFDNMLDSLREKKNIVLQGPPGVGKTFIADRLAYALIGAIDATRIERIQFHQSYSYEDFIQGFRPTSKGYFDLKRGIFYQFCRNAQRDEKSRKPNVFIIDEINRGNLSKIFGELMMLIEPDKRGKEFAMPLTYSEDADERFYIPENVYLIGTMNTADRSLAMVDYALRRRFRFITLEPAFESKAFFKYLGECGVAQDLIHKIVNRMAELNSIIENDTKNLGPGYRIGHSYFCPNSGTRADEAWYRRVVESEIVPLIQEYWFDNEQKVKDYQAKLLED